MDPRLTRWADGRRCRVVYPAQSRREPFSSTRPCSTLRCDAAPRPSSTACRSPSPPPGPPDSPDPPIRPPTQPVQQQQTDARLAAPFREDYLPSHSRLVCRVALRQIHGLSRPTVWPMRAWRVSASVTAESCSADWVGSSRSILTEGVKLTAIVNM